MRIVWGSKYEDVVISICSSSPIIFVCFKDVKDSGDIEKVFP